MRLIQVERQQVVDDAVLWLSLLSVAAICLVMFFYGAWGLTGLHATPGHPLRQAFFASVYVLFIILPLLILNLVMESAFITRAFEWSLSLIYIAIVADIILMTALYLLM